MKHFYLSKNILTAVFILIGSFLLSAQTVSFSSKMVIDDNLEKAKKNQPADIDQDGDIDIVCTANPEGSSGAEDENALNVALYLNDGSNAFSKKTISAKFRTARGLAVGDLNGDSYPDVVVGNSNVDSVLVWFKNPVSSYDSAWRKYHLGGAAPYNYIVRLIDFDGDSDLDIVDGMGDAAAGGSVAGDYIRWFENDGNSSPTFTEHQIINYPTPSGIAVADFDSDSDYDIAGMAWTYSVNSTAQTDEDVRWWAQNSLTSFSQQEIIKTAYAGNDAQAADMDGDGDQDLIGAGYKVKTIDWWANNGSGQFGSSLYTVRTSFNHSRNVQVVDLDGDDDLDLLACADDDNLVAWFENDGSQNFVEHTIDNNFTYAYFVTAHDLDGDGDVDVIGTAQDAVETGNTIQGQLAWWKNNQAEEQSIASGDPAPVNFYSGKVVVDFQSGFTGGLTSVFYNHGDNQNRSSVGGGLNHIAQKGFYTIRTLASTYDGSIDFYYDGLSEWSAINNEADLRMAYWDSGTKSWVLAGTSQTVDQINNKITVNGIAGQLHNFARFTLASVSSDNSLPVTLTLFKYQKERAGIWLNWQTASELENLGFEVWRSQGTDSNRVLVESYLNNEELQGQGNSSTGASYRFFDDRLLPGNTYYYYLIQVDYSGRRNEVGKLSVDFVPESLTRVVNGQTPQDISLLANFPNPFNNSTTIVFTLKPGKQSGAQNVRLKIYDIQGRLVRDLFEGALSAGEYRLYWDGRNNHQQVVPTGKYVCFLSSQRINKSRILTLVR